MLIESIFRRKGGSFIPFGPAAKPTVVYHFAPESDDKDAKHVCEVTDPDHIARFLSITEGYRLAEPEKPKKETKKAPDVPDYRKMKPEDLLHAFRMKFGRSPSGLMKAENIIAKLEE